MYDLHVFVKADRRLIASFPVGGINGSAVLSNEVSFAIVPQGTTCLVQKQDGNVYIDLHVIEDVPNATTEGVSSDDCEGTAAGEATSTA